MFRRIFLTALLAGFLSGSCISIIHEFTTTPIIFHAEKFERKGISKEQIVGFDKSMPLSLSHNLKKMREIKLMVTQPVPYDWERAFLSAISNIITGVGFSLILVACFSLCQAKIGGRQGVVWGMAGFGVVSLAPSLGLPPEIPGVFTADLGTRQMWWFICVGATASGLWVSIFRSGKFWVPFGIIFAVFASFFLFDKLDCVRCNKSPYYKPDKEQYLTPKEFMDRLNMTYNQADYATVLRFIAFWKTGNDQYLNANHRKTFRLISKPMES